MKTLRTPSQYQPPVVVAGLACRYNEKLDELRIYKESTKESVVFIQGFSTKFRGVPEMSVELLVWLATNYKEVRLAV